MKNLLLPILFLVTILCFPIIGLAQIFKGKLLDQKGSPISEAYVYNTKANDYALSNELGFFQLQNTKDDDIIKITHLGFETKEITIKNVEQETTPIITLAPNAMNLDQITISNQPIVLNSLIDIELKTNPVKSAQEILRQVPGLIIGQHAGGGKAEQLFLRGFDIDHGTDVSISVDGLPVNMVSHAHGQGYADLHFLIPELIDNIDYGKGTYYANKGNFTTAGYVDLRTKETLNDRSVSVEYGQFNTNRTVVLFDLWKNPTKHKGYIAGELLNTNGYFDSPQNFTRLNLTGKYTASINETNKLSLSLSHFQSDWTASGQIPQRAIDAGLISRFGAIDDTEGGNTSRSNALATYTTFFNTTSFLKSKVYYTKYDFELYSNFTFFLNNPVNGDQIKQKENRRLYGAESVFQKDFFGDNIDITLKSGAGLRQDIVKNVELSRTLNRNTTLSNVALGDVQESNAYAFTSVDFNFGQWLIQPALRFDYFRFGYTDQLETNPLLQTADKARFSPKFNVFYTPSTDLQLFWKSGIGFHSNDSRVVVNKNDLPTLPIAYGTDVGAIWKPSKKLIVNTALWFLWLEQEFVYVGDEGIVELSGQTQRTGIDASVQYQLSDWLFFDMDINYALARSVEESDGNDYIPLAPAFTSSGGFSVRHPSGVSGSLRYRYIGDRPANEDYSLTAEGYCITDASVNYDWKKVSLGLIAENLLNTSWNETQFATNSQLRNEIEPVEEIHFTPGSPFFIKGKVTYRF